MQASLFYLLCGLSKCFFFFYHLFVCLYWPMHYLILLSFIVWCILVWLGLAGCQMWILLTQSILITVFHCLTFFVNLLLLYVSVMWGWCFLNEHQYEGMCRQVMGSGTLTWTLSKFHVWFDIIWYQLFTLFCIWKGKLCRMFNVTALFWFPCALYRIWF